MSVAPPSRERLEQYGQGHLLRWWDELDDAARSRLAAEIRALDLDELATLVSTFVKGEGGDATLPLDQVEPVDVSRLPQTDAERSARRKVAELGESVLAAGEVGVVLVAGGLGTRLGFDGPKGTYPIGPVDQTSLFQIHAEKIVALSRRHGKPIPLYVMTSPDNHEATTSFFEAHRNFGLPRVRFFIQGQMPAVDQANGQVLLAAKDHLALSPDGHGGTLYALAQPGADGAPSCLEEMASLGIRTIFYFQVDNPMVKIADPAFLGLHRQVDADMSFKVIEKISPEEKVGVVVEVGGTPQVIEYSDLPASLAERREADGRLALWAGSIAVHVLERAFIERLVHGDTRLPFHRAIKKVEFIDERGEPIKPAAPNAIKFERFIFDALPMASRWAMVETDRSLEFEPLKNATGPDSPATVRQRMSELFADWLESAGASVTRRSDGTIPFGIEISPLFALDASELRSRIQPGLVVDGPLSLR